MKKYSPGWMGGWMGGWMDIKAVLRIAYSSQKSWKPAPTKDAMLTV